MGTFGGRVRNAAGEVRQRLLVVDPLKYGSGITKGLGPVALCQDCYLLLVKNGDIF
jgi:hypothetical protein